MKRTASMLLVVTVVACSACKESAKPDFSRDPTEVQATAPKPAPRRRPPPPRPPPAQEPIPDRDPEPPLVNGEAPTL